jgi:hypothetical protein
MGAALGLLFVFWAKGALLVGSAAAGSILERRR